jgi:hypothetical protein
LLSGPDGGGIWWTKKNRYFSVKNQWDMVFCVLIFDAGRGYPGNAGNRMDLDENKDNKMIYRIRDAIRYYLVLNLICMTIFALTAIFNAYQVSDDYFPTEDVLRAAISGIDACVYMVGWWLLPLIAVIRYRQLSGTELPWLPETPGAPCLFVEMFSQRSGGYVSGDDDEWRSAGADSVSRPLVNVDGSPMCGDIDIHGNPYGVSNHQW